MIANVGGGLWTVIADYEAGGAESSKTFTINPAINFDDISQLLLVIDLVPTLQLALELKLNGLTATYYLDGSKIVSGTETIIDDSNTSEFIIADSTIIGGVDARIFGFIHIGVSKGAVTDFPLIVVDMSAGNGIVHFAGRIATESTEINEIIVETSTSTWKTGSRMTLYKLSRS